MARIGIGVVTYNRRDLVRETVQCVRRYTRREDVDLVVADDGSTDGTLAMLRQDDVAVVTGVNMGVAWNKNRALYLLAQIRRCDVVILLEDDTQPAAPGWEAPWIEVARRWGHANIAGSWFDQQYVSGRGTPDDPVMSKVVSAQCSAFSRQALDWGGYLDPRFRGFGYEHAEHTARMVRTGFGGTAEMVDGKQQVLFALIKSDLVVREAVSNSVPEQVERNLQLAHQLMPDNSYRVPWRDRAELHQFRAEITHAIEARPGGFALRGSAPAATPRRTGLVGLARLFRRRA